LPIVTPGPLIPGAAEDCVPAHLRGQSLRRAPRAPSQRSCHAFIARLALSLLGAATAFSATAEPVKIRVGRGNAGEEQLWLMATKPQVTPNQGKTYMLEMTNFPATDKRFLAFEAGELDIATGSANSVILFASTDAHVNAIASISQESRKGFFTQYMVRKETRSTRSGNSKARPSALTASTPRSTFGRYWRCNRPGSIRART
jgi:hypothetical protein